MFNWKEPIYNVVTTEGKLDALCSLIESSIKKEIPICIDVETTGLSPYYNYIIGVNICFGVDEGWYIPIEHTKDGLRRSEQLPSRLVAKKLDAVMSVGGVYIGHNIKFDYKFLWKMGTHIFPQVFDTMSAIQIIAGNAYVTRALKKVITNYVNIPPIKIQSFASAADGNVQETDPVEFCTYAINDVIFTYYVYNALKPIIDRDHSKLFYGAEMALIPILAHMEMTGIIIDDVYLSKLKKPLLKYREKIASWFKNNHKINVGSAAQVGKLFNDNFKMLKLKRSPKTQNIVTDIQELTNMQQTFPRRHPVHKIAKRVATYRGINKHIGTYIEKFPNICEKFYVKGQIINVLHTDFDQIKNSGRMSSKPNVQNIPRDSIINIRKGFVSRPGYKFIEADWASAELRLTAILSGEPVMVNAYKKDPLTADLHVITAKGVFGKETVTDNERFIGKTLNFSILYGATEYSVSKTLSCSLTEAKEYIDRFNSTYPAVKNWKDGLIEFIKVNNYTQTLYKRRRYAQANVAHGMYERWKWEGECRALINHVIQGSNADLLKFSMVAIAKQLAECKLDAHLITTTHDSIACEVKEDVVHPVSQIMKNTMEVTIKGILMPVDFSISDTLSKEK